MKKILPFQWIVFLTFFVLCFLETYGRGGGRGGGGSRGSSSSGRGSSSSSRGSSGSSYGSSSSSHGSSGSSRISSSSSHGSSGSSRSSSASSHGSSGSSRISSDSGRGSSSSSSLSDSNGYGSRGNSHGISNSNQKFSNSYGSGGSLSSHHYRKQIHSTDYGTGSYGYGRNKNDDKIDSSYPTARYTTMRPSYHRFMFTPTTSNPFFSIEKPGVNLPNFEQPDYRPKSFDMSFTPMRWNERPEPNYNILVNVKDPNIRAYYEHMQNRMSSDGQKHLQSGTNRSPLSPYRSAEDQQLSFSPDRSSQPYNFQGISPSLMGRHSELHTQGLRNLELVSSQHPQTSKAVQPNQLLRPIVTKVQHSRDPALCKETCLNGGSCASPGVCKCPTDYRGPRCEYSFMECDVRKLVGDAKINWVCTHTQTETKCKIKCKGSKRFESPPAEEYKCMPNGTWAQMHVPQCIKPGYGTVNDKVTTEGMFERQVTRNSNFTEMY